MTQPEPELVVRIHDDLSSIDRAAWNGLLAVQQSPTPFLRHEYLAALQASGSATEATGWTASFICIESQGELRGAAPLYRKTHSYGEYVFDWAWADAYRRHGLNYYPKLLGALPFTPVPGTRLLARDDAVRSMLVTTITRMAEEARLSSAHVLFVDEVDAAAFANAGWMLRHGVQFHWTQDLERPVSDFSSLLAGMQRHKRKNILQERRRVAEAGVTFSVHRGSEITPSLWDFFHRCYELTYAAHHSTPYLTRRFFQEMASSMPEHWLMFVAHRQGAPIAASLVAIDERSKAAWGRYWGCVDHVPCLHFEACYYQPLSWCLANGYVRFEGGAQGEHKMARGLLPAPTASAHWLRDARFADAVADFLAREGAGIEEYVDELRERSPFKTTS